MYQLIIEFDKDPFTVNNLCDHNDLQVITVIFPYEPTKSVTSWSFMSTEKRFNVTVTKESLSNRSCIEDDKTGN